MTREELTQQHWQYYLLLERRFLETIDYVGLHKSNFGSFSDTYAMLMQAIGAELDTAFKIYCGFAKTDRKTIAVYVKSIDTEESDADSDSHAKKHPFRQQIIYLNAYNLMIQPFKDWDSNCPAQSLFWWDAFDKVKHNRIDNKELANQENCLNMLGALYLLDMKMLKKIVEDSGAAKTNGVMLEADQADIFDKGSELFSLKDWTTIVPRGMEAMVFFEMLANDGKSKYSLFDA